jgi:hypothetical protein
MKSSQDLQESKTKSFKMGLNKKNLSESKVPSTLMIPQFHRQNVSQRLPQVSVIIDGQRNILNFKNCNCDKCEY